MSGAFQGSKKKAREVRTAHNAQQRALNDELIRCIGSLILEHGKVIVDKDLARLSQGMKMLVRDRGNVLEFTLYEPDGTLYTLEETHGSRLQGNGDGTGVLGREIDVQQLVQDQQPESAGVSPRDLDPHASEEAGGTRDRLSNEGRTAESEGSDELGSREGDAREGSEGGSD